MTFKYLMHEYYSLDLSRKTKNAKYEKMKRGEYQSKVCCYGYRKGPDGRLTIDEEAAAVVRRIVTLTLEAKHAGDIVKILYAGVEEEGIEEIIIGAAGSSVPPDKVMLIPDTPSRL